MIPLLLASLFYNLHHYYSAPLQASPVQLPFLFSLFIIKQFEGAGVDIFLFPRSYTISSPCAIRMAQMPSAGPRLWQVCSLHMPLLGIGRSGRRARATVTASVTVNFE